MLVFWIVRLSVFVSNKYRTAGLIMSWRLVISSGENIGGYK
jgi:hypothetical protein